MLTVVVVVLVVLVVEVVVLVVGIVVTSWVVVVVIKVDMTGAVDLVTVFDVTIPAYGTIAFTTRLRPSAASFSIKALTTHAEKLAAFVGLRRVSCTCVASTRDVVMNS